MKFIRYLLLPVAIVLVAIAAIGELADAAYWKLYRLVQTKTKGGK